MKKKALVILLLVVMLVGTFATFSYGADKKTGLYKENGQWRYFENGTFKAATGLVQRPDNKTWHYVENGIYKKSTGLVQCVQPGSSKGKWYYVERGDLNNKATGLVQCIQPGSSKGKWYYVKNGKLRESTGITKCVHAGSKSYGKSYFVENGKLKKFTGLVQYNGESWYLQNGKIDTKKNGVVKGNGNRDSQGDGYFFPMDYYYLKSGRVDTKHDQLIKLNGEMIYFSRGRGPWKEYGGIVINEDGGWIVHNGKVNYDYNGEFVTPELYPCEDTRVEKAEYSMTIKKADGYMSHQVKNGKIVKWGTVEGTNQKKAAKKCEEQYQDGYNLIGG